MEPTLSTYYVLNYSKNLLPPVINGKPSLSQCYFTYYLLGLLSDVKTDQLPN